MEDSASIRILLVCMGNICRSPTAEGVLRERLRQAGLQGVVETDSAGTHDYHIGKAPDPRAQDAASQRGIDISDLRARQVERSDFDEFDLILAMDQDNFDLLRADCPPKHADKLGMFLDYAPQRREREVPDPYFGGRQGFELVYDLIEEASEGLVDDLKQRLGRSRS
ncbi:low molecular weight phosphotyrosine protein phosphatase [Halorhodospira halochloris]|uniref:low molecular weight protein-tyrosine-phosphatase n=1 Tax=Halorhodospira halochloris TaxID=1052 RepID=UPI001EE8C761|nr:low molecular weight protein-tyrosine-phosphatase [Halorhodospira halochloris]MCG5530780.1 low molecular weight phosphotyrosine protein phosphatase [Halorhodospira halochloris]